VQLLQCVFLGDIENPQAVGVVVYSPLPYLLHLPEGCMVLPFSSCPSCSWVYGTSTHTYTELLLCVGRTAGAIRNVPAACYTSHDLYVSDAHMHPHLRSLCDTSENIQCGISVALPCK